MTQKPNPPFLNNIQIHSALTNQDDSIKRIMEKSNAIDHTFKSTDEFIPAIEKIESMLAESGISNQADGATAIIMSSHAPNHKEDNSDRAVTELCISRVSNDWHITEINTIHVCPEIAGKIEIYLTDKQLEAIEKKGKSIENYKSKSKKDMTEEQFDKYLKIAGQTPEP